MLRQFQALSCVIKRIWRVPYCVARMTSLSNIVEAHVTGASRVWSNPQIPSGSDPVSLPGEAFGPQEDTKRHGGLTRPPCFPPRISIRGLSHDF